MKKEYTVKEAAEILGMDKQSLHSVISWGGMKVRKTMVGGVPYIYISRKVLEDYGKRKIESLQGKINKMRMDLLERPLTKKELAQCTDKGGYAKGEGQTYQG